MLNALVTVAAEEGHTTNPLLPHAYDIIWSAVCLAIVLVVVIFVAIPRLNKVLDARAEAIEGNIEKADAAQKEAEAALEEYTKQLAEARVQAGEIREAATENAKKIVAEAKAQAAAEADRIQAAAQAQIEAERQATLISLRSEVGGIALDLAGNVIGETLSDDEKAKSVVDRFLADLEASQEAAK
ncbi:F0F1 ATP synthase subunit B [Microbacterium sediminis]|uniref:ATP synthase subunit b n=1 Tax=Microbacterium sediminis TaxID=904291 RepID=A0A1B9NCI2_9MICO|nr:F0F1 ATP synthase subunit B [Microbacterium sediminis]OCG74302.1 F0F1 ATP synthase subunit B [Microbacterium sediminis]QBR73666.1 F0F1 ATP synthase subunit B [Microbacterium sediminis]